MRRLSVNLSGVSLSYLDSGGNGVPIVLLHANTGTSESWGLQFSAFTEAGYRVIAFDRRGWGASLPDPASGPQPGSVAEDLAALVESLKLPPFHLLGVAGGGFVAIDYAAWKQENLRSLIVAASTGSFNEAEMERLTANLTFEGFRQLPEAFREIGPTYRASEPERTMAWSEAQEKARQPGAAVQPLRTPNTFAKISEIKIATLGITASADLYAPPVLMQRWMRELSRIEIVAIADSGHSVPMEQPELFNRAVLDFVQRH